MAPLPICPLPGSGLALRDRLSPIGHGRCLVVGGFTEAKVDLRLAACIKQYNPGSIFRYGGGPVQWRDCTQFISAWQQTGEGIEALFIRFGCIQAAVGPLNPDLPGLKPGL